MNVDDVKTKINAMLDTTINAAEQKMKSGKALRANYHTEEMEEYIETLKDLKRSFNDHFWVPNEKK